MIDWIPIVYMIGMAIAWLLTGFQGYRLYQAFSARYPQEADRLIPFAFSNTKHTEKFIFFFRKTSEPMLKADSQLWKLRQRLKLYLFVSLFIQFGGFGLIAGIGLVAMWMEKSVK